LKEFPHPGRKASEINREADSSNMKPIDYILRTNPHLRSAPPKEEISNQVEEAPTQECQSTPGKFISKEFESKMERVHGQAVLAHIKKGGCKMAYN